MSSAANHKKRSCRSAKRKQATFGSIHRNVKYDLPRTTYGEGFLQRLFSGRNREARTVAGDKEASI